MDFKGVRGIDSSIKGGGQKLCFSQAEYKVQTFVP